jgi:hypothetical protein
MLSLNTMEYNTINADMVKVDDELKKKLFDRMFELEYEISTWGSRNSQSNPGAVMELRDMRRKLERIKVILGLK